MVPPNTLEGLSTSYVHLKEDIEFLSSERLQRGMNPARGCDGQYRCSLKCFVLAEGLSPPEIFSPSVVLLFLLLQLFCCAKTP